MHDPLRALALLVAATFGQVAMADTHDGYALGPQDVLMIRVGHWDVLVGAYVGWTDVSGEYTVGPDGTLALPLAGQIVAAGLGASEVAAEIQSALRDRLLSRDEVQVTADIVRFRPVYVLGAVRSPGAYPYSPGLTVLQAITLAGGAAQGGVEFQRNTRTALASLGNYEVLKLGLMRRLATEARLAAESEGQTSVVMPPEMEGAAVADELMRREGEIFTAQTAALASALSQLDSLEALLRTQIDQLTEQVQLRELQLQLANEELENIKDLVARGLTVAGRRIELESRVADQEIRLLELATARLNAEQRLNEAGRERLDLVNSRTREVAEQLLLVRGEIEELRVRMRTEAALYSEAAQYEDGSLQLDGLGASDLELTRAGAAAVAVERSDVLQPGDVLELVVPLPGTGLAARPLASDNP